jgi:hypothetical protein
MPSPDRLLDLQDRISAHLDEIALLFTQRPKMTLVIRTPWLEAEGKDGGVLIGDDDLDRAIAEINRLRKREPIHASGV